MKSVPKDRRHFLMLQGPHGPFFAQLADALRSSGAEVWRVGFNSGDAFFWRRANYIAFRDPPASWPQACADLLDRLGITDLVLYGDSRPIHAQGIAAARQRGIRVHVFEEGYLRPYWVTYERNGANGNSRLIDVTIDEMRTALAHPGTELPHPPAKWGEMREHIFYGALYHFCVMVMNGGYKNFLPHRGIAVSREFKLHLRRLCLIPWYWIERAIAQRHIRHRSFPYHVALLQLDHDASFRAHSDLTGTAELIGLCIAEFARGAPSHHHLVFKAHPLEDGRVPLSRLIRDGAEREGVAERVHFVRGGKLAVLLNAARSAVTVNSTAGQQVLWRGLPLLALGRAVYCKPELVSSQSLRDFFAAPHGPDPRAYRAFRQFLLETSQIPGGFYGSRSRRHLLRQIVDLMLVPADPYETLMGKRAAPPQQLRAVL